jgi:methionyl aminopeptidase
MKDEVANNYREAGKIAAKILAFASKEVQVGARYLDVVEEVEGRVIAEDAGLAFPLNVSLNEDAAHDTASPGDDRMFVQGDLVKLDLGVHLDGYIADTAITIDLGSHERLIEASREALASAIALVRPGVTIGELGAAVQYEIESRGCRPIANLTGHGLERYMVHKPPNVPNIGIQGGAQLVEDMVFAIEPFASTGTGHVSERRRIEIYSQVSRRPVRLASARRIIEKISDRHGMPFARRWLGKERLDVTLSTMFRNGVLHAYPVLADIQGSFVSQHEHTLIVTADGCIVTTA